MESTIHYATLLCALGTGIVGGVFFAFSLFVMKSLAQRVGWALLTVLSSRA